MTEAEKEAFYDKEVAPVLLDLVRKCQDNGLSLISMAEWHPGETGRTVSLRENSGIGIRMAEMAMRCHGNVDQFMLAMTKYAKEHGHNSIFIAQFERQQPLA